MTATFYAIVALVAAAVLAFVLHPLVRRRAEANVSHDAVNLAVYRDQLRELQADLAAGSIASDQYERARLEIERRLLDETGVAQAAQRRSRVPLPVAVTAGAVLAACALALYWILGAPQAMNPMLAADEGAEHALSQARLNALTDQLAARMKEQPDRTEGWVMLARSYAALGRFQEAAGAFAEASARIPDDAQLLADYADVYAMMQGRRLAGEPEKLIARALAADPDNVKALALAGSAQFEKKNYAKAVALWEKLVAVAPPDSELAASVRNSIAEARELGKLGGGALAALAPVARPPAQGAAKAPAGGGAGAAPGGARLTGVASLAPSLSARVKPDDTVFIFARAAEGPRVPLAVLRRQAKDLPVEFALDDSMAMSPGMNLSAFPRVVVSARVSRSSNAAAQPGDLQGESAPVAVGAAERVRVVIDTEVR